jgi:hypothetical protein
MTITRTSGRSVVVADAAGGQDPVGVVGQGAAVVQAPTVGQGYQVGVGRVALGDLLLDVAPLWWRRDTRLPT